MNKKDPNTTSSQTDVERNFTVNELKKFVIKIKRQLMEIEKQQMFCKAHNFNLEAEVKRNEAETVRKIAHKMENEFDLGFVWDKSLD